MEVSFPTEICITSDVTIKHKTLRFSLAELTLIHLTVFAPFARAQKSANEQLRVLMNGMRNERRAVKPQVKT